MRIRHITTLVLLAVIAAASLHGRGAPSALAEATCYNPITNTEVAATQSLSSPGRLNGTNGPDVLVGSDGDDVINGNGGDDLICGGGGSDRLSGGNGNDIINDQEDLGNLANGGAGDDYITGKDAQFEYGFQGDAHGGAGNDHVSVTDANAYGDAGDDSYITANPGNAFGGSGDDAYVYALGGTADGQSGNDYVAGADYGPDVLRGGSGNDVVVAHSPNTAQIVDGGSGRDTCRPWGAPNSSCERLEQP